MNITNEKKIRRIWQWLSAHRFEFALFFVYTLVIAIVAYPVVLKMSSVMFGVPGDSSGVVWFFWWQKYSLSHGLQFSNVYLQGAPFGVDWSGVPQIPVVYYPALILTYLTNELFAYNFLVLMTFPISAMTMYFLTKHITKNRAASAVAGLIYGFAPFHFAHSMGHLGNITALQWLPLVVLALIVLKERQSFKAAIVFGGCLALVVLTDFYNAYFVLLFAAAFAAFNLLYQFVSDKKDWFKKQARLLFLIFIGLLICATIAVPFIMSQAKTAVTKPSSYAAAYQDLIVFSARPWEYIVPAIANPLLGSRTYPFLLKNIHGSNFMEQSLYLGITSIILASIAFYIYVYKRKKLGDLKNETYWVGLFSFSALIMAVLSGPPFVDIGPIRIPLFSSLAYKFLPMFRAYARLGIVVLLCVAVLAGLGLAYLLRRISTANWRKILILGIVALIAFEFADVPPVTDFSKTPPEYGWLIRQPGNFIVAEYPLKQSIYLDNYEYMFNQRIHKKRLFNGSTLGTKGEAYRSLSEDITSDKSASILEYLGIKYAIVHWGKYDKPEPTKIGKGFQLIRRFPDQTAVYFVEAVLSDYPLLLIVSGFGMPEKWIDGESHRWIGDSAQITIVNTGKQSRKATLTFQAASFKETRMLSVRQGTRLVKSVTVGINGKTVEVAGLTLSPGENRFTFEAKPSAEQIDPILHNGDFRVVSIETSRMQVKFDQ